jgi:ribonuclease P protein component
MSKSHSSFPNRQMPVAVLIAKSRFAFRSEFFDVKVLVHAADQTINQSSAFLCQESNPLKGRLVIAVPRRIGSAPIRNRCRRRIRELMRTMKLSLLPCDFIFFVRSSFARVPTNALCEILEKLRVCVKKCLYNS